MNVTCTARTTTIGVRPTGDHGRLPMADPDRTAHACGKDLDPETADHIGEHVCRVCGIAFSLGTQMPIAPQRETHTDDGTATGGEGVTRESEAVETPRPVAISLPVTEDSFAEHRLPRDDGWPGRQFRVFMPGEPTPDDWNLNDWTTVERDPVTGRTVVAETRAAFDKRTGAARAETCPAVESAGVPCENCEQNDGECLAMHRLEREANPDYARPPWDSVACIRCGRTRKAHGVTLTRENNRPVCASTDMVLCDTFAASNRFRVIGTSRAVDWWPGRTHPTPFARGGAVDPLGTLRLPTSEVDKAMARANELDGLWQRTDDLLRSVADELAALDPNRDPVVQVGQITAAAVVDIHKARLNLERLRPTRDTDVAAALTTLTLRVTTLDARVQDIAKRADPVAVADRWAARPHGFIPTGLLTNRVCHLCKRDKDAGPHDQVQTPKPASYLVDGLVPHPFRHDGSTESRTLCTWSNGGIPCGYAANAQVHRAMLREPAPYERERNP